MIRCAIIVFLLSCSNVLFAQTWTWDQQVANRSGGKIVADRQHNWYAFDQDSNYVNKYSSSGALAFGKTFPGLHVVNVIYMPDSGFCIAGNFTTSVVVETNTFAVPGAGFVVIRYNSAGVLLWLKKGHSMMGSRVGDICASGNNLVITGTAADTLFYGNVSIPKSMSPEMFVLLLDGTGGIIDHTFAEVAGTQGVSPGQAKSAGLEIETDIYGNVFVYAFIHGKASIDTVAISAAPYWSWNELWALKLDQGLNLVWDHYLDQAVHTKNTWHCMRVNSAGEIFMLVYRGSQYGVSRSDVIKIDGNGNRVNFYFSLPMNEGRYGWNRRFVDLQLDSCDNIYVTGSNHGYFPLMNRSKYYLLNFQLSPQAQVLWKSVDSSDHRRTGTGLAVLAPNHLLIAGNFTDSITLQNVFVGNYLVGSGSYTNNMGYFHARLNTTVGTPQNITALAKQKVCENESGVLTVAANGIVSWYNSAVSNTALATGFSYTTPALSPGTHTFYAEANSCTLTSGRAAITITVDPLPQLSVNNGSVCQGDTFLLLPAGAASYTLSSGSVFVTPTVTTLYYITGSSYQGCTVGVVSQVSVMPPPVITIQSNLNYLCAGEEVTLSAGGAASYTWSNGAVSPTLAVTPAANASFSVTGKDIHGCVASGTMIQYVADCVGVEEHANSVSVSPNPATDHVIVTTPFPAEVTISDLSGKVFYSQQVSQGSTAIKRGCLAGGCYLLRVAGPESVGILRIIFN